MNIDQANAQAVERMMQARPVLIGMGIARDVIPGMRDNLLLHAGPPITWDRMSGPLRGAVIGALIFEGLAKTEDDVRAIVARGEIAFEPCHHHAAVGPMAGVISPSMQVYIIENKTHGNRAYSGLNEGYGKVLRYGAYSDDVLKRLRWMNDVMAPMLADAIGSADGGVDMQALIAEALHMGDEGHNRLKAGSMLFLRALAPNLAKVLRSAPSQGSQVAEILKFMGDTALTSLNAVMASCKAMADAAHGIANSTIVTAMARNGTDFGIRVSGLGDQWFVAPAEIPVGLYFPGFKAEDANRDIGDSTITETAGIGGFAMAAAPAIVTFVSGKPQDAINTTLEMYEIAFAEHKYFSIPYLDFRGTPVGIDIRKVVEKNITPRVNTGIAHKDAGVGQIGAGLVRPPMAVFKEALFTFAEKHGV
ncbi:MAG: DUF1116 domain-containing protein [Chloroflexi bacterium]|nr:DUF1116 domain-containing protein [Chloroflexota bacterium]